MREKKCLHFLYGEEAIFCLDSNREEKEQILALAKGYKRLGEVLYIADEKNMVEDGAVT